MTLQQFYEKIGGDYEGTLKRLPTEAMVKKFVLKYPGDPSFDELTKAIAEKDWETAFRASHTLKGVAQNLGMTKLYEVDAELCEQMRGGKPMTDPALYDAVAEVHNKVLEAVKELDA